jgi:Uma2 family endonuclease
MGPARKVATYAALEAMPANQVGEIVGGVLHASRRPSARHAAASSALGEELGPPFRRGRGGPGGWVILDAPELHLSADVVVPDLAGWRRAGLPDDAFDGAAVTVAPSWVCEVLSRSTARFDRHDKLDVYKREAVAHVWLVDPSAQTLEILRLDGPTYRLAATFAGDASIRAEPFDAIELPLGALWTI